MDLSGVSSTPSGASSGRAREKTPRKYAVASAAKAARTTTRTIHPGRMRAPLIRAQA
jgi:hypothetical protein